MTPLHLEAASKIRYHVDAVWCDVHGVYARGWAHCEDEPVVALHLRCGDLVAVVEDRHPRPDVRAVFPDIHAGDCGFAGYLACPPFQPVSLGISTGGGTTEFPLQGPVQSQAADADPVDDPFARFLAAMKHVRGNVVEIGARAVSPGATLQAERFAPECTFTGVDIHAAPGVDVVVDAQYLSTVIAPCSVDGVFSLAVLEHVAAPWLVAAEINRVLKIGGLTYHVVPSSWPVHEMPNDFWRMSHEGLKVMFGAATGFEVARGRDVDAGADDPAPIAAEAAVLGVSARGEHGRFAHPRAKDRASRNGRRQLAACARRRRGAEPRVSIPSRRCCVTGPAPSPPPARRAQPSTITRN